MRARLASDRVPGESRRSETAESWRRAPNVALGERSPRGEASYIVISSKAVSGQSTGRRQSVKLNFVIGSSRSQPVAA